MGVPGLIDQRDIGSSPENRRGSKNRRTENSKQPAFQFQDARGETETLKIRLYDKDSLEEFDDLKEARRSGVDERCVA